MVDMSDTPAGMIARLDDALSRRGQTVTLRRLVPDAPAVEQQVRAVVRGYRPDELTGGITIGASKVILSPTSLTGSPFAAAYPQAGDKMMVGGRLRNVEGADPIIVNDVLVRMNLMVTG